MINLVIPAAGAATRLRPLSTNTSKVMVRVNGKPCLDYIIEQAKKLTEISQIVVVDGQFDDIRNYCDRRWPEVTCVKQLAMNGPRDAIKIGMNALKNSSLPVVVWLGDAIILEENLPMGKDFLLTKKVDNHSSWCMWDGVGGYYNKPSTPIKDAVALVGLYSFENGIDAEAAFKMTDDYDISGALYDYTLNHDKTTMCRSFESVETTKWYDIGDLPTYYKTCATLLDMKSRAFNRLEYNHDLGTIRKSPDYHDSESMNTIKSEISWYKALDQNQQCFVPRVVESGNDLIMSFESGTLLSDLMLYENLTESAWEYIIDKLFRIKLNYFNNRSTDIDFNEKFDDESYDMWFGKTEKRLRNLDRTYAKIAKIAYRVSHSTRPISGMHGDLHFGNILYNQQTDQIKLFDPRGRYGSVTGTYGDDIYDWAKLSHDVVHGYSAMVNNASPNEIVKKVFLKKLDQYGLPVDLIVEAGLVLLATCIPLHYDSEDRQQRFIDYVENYSI